jgi:putative toxin-antitoxin system antitoxin component (TIGR02293 family)
MSYIWVSNVGYMKKNTPKKKPGTYKTNDAVSKAEEPIAPYYRSVKVIPLVKDFTYNEFKKIADKVPFTQAEWAVILHVSERTLQRYAKNNGTFAPINAERALQLAKIIKEGIATFGNAGLFYNWIKRKPYMLEGSLSFESLTTTDGIQKVLTQLGRIQHGIFA